MFSTAIYTRGTSTNRGIVSCACADDFVVLCRSEDEAKEGLAAVERLLADRLGLSLSAEKMEVTRFHEGFSFLPLRHQVSVREDASQAPCVNNVENFKTKVRRITRRSHNLDADVIVQLNRVIRGTANYFAMPWSHCGDAYRSLDRWIRMRLRCMPRLWKTRQTEVANG